MAVNKCFSYLPQTFTKIFQNESRRFLHLSKTVQTTSGPKRNEQEEKLKKDDKDEVEFEELPQEISDRDRYIAENNDPKAVREGVPRSFITLLTQPYDLSLKGIANYIRKYKDMSIKEDHRFIAERHSTLGPDLATAHFLVKRGAKVKFVGRNIWFERDEKKDVPLPNQYVEGFHLEAIDASKVPMSYVAFDNMIQLQHLKYLNFSHCRDFNDWCCQKMHQFAHSLEFLDITGCSDVTENGLACLHVLKNLKGLKLSQLPNVENMGLIVLLLEEHLPDCTIFGIEEEKLDPDYTVERKTRLPERTQIIMAQLDHDQQLPVHLDRNKKKRLASS